MAGESDGFRLLIQKERNRSTPVHHNSYVDNVYGTRNDHRATTFSSHPYSTVTTSGIDNEPFVVEIPRITVLLIHTWNVWLSSHAFCGVASNLARYGEETSALRCALTPIKSTTPTFSLGQVGTTSKRNHNRSFTRHKITVDSSTQLKGWISLRIFPLEERDPEEKRTACFGFAFLPGVIFHGILFLCSPFIHLLRSTVVYKNDESPFHWINT